MYSLCCRWKGDTTEKNEIVVSLPMNVLKSTAWGIILRSKCSCCLHFQKKIDDQKRFLLVCRIRSLKGCCFKKVFWRVHSWTFRSSKLELADHAFQPLCFCLRVEPASCIFFSFRFCSLELILSRKIMSTRQKKTNKSARRFGRRSGSPVTERINSFSAPPITHEM